MRAPLENLILRVISLILAIMLWLVIAGEKTSEIALTAPIVFHNFPVELELTGSTPRVVQVWVRASPGIIQRLQTDDIQAQLDLAGSRKGQQVVHLTGSSIRVPFGVDVVKILPSSFVLTLDKTVQKTLAVRPTVSGDPAPNYVVDIVEVQPKIVTVRGPEETLRTMESVPTEPLSVAGAQINVTGDVSVAPEDAAVQVLGDPRVRMTIGVEPIIATPRPRKEK